MKRYIILLVFIFNISLYAGITMDEDVTETEAKNSQTLIDIFVDFNVTELMKPFEELEEAFDKFKDIVYGIFNGDGFDYEEILGMAWDYIQKKLDIEFNCTSAPDVIKKINELQGKANNKQEQFAYYMSDMLKQETIISKYLYKLVY